MSRPHIERPIVLRKARIFNGASATLIEGRDVLVVGNIIKDLLPQGQAVADARAIDCAGKVIMPGLIDAHWHSTLAAVPLMTALRVDVSYIYLLAAQEAERTILRGFTTVRDVGGPSFALKRAIDENRIPGPRIYPSGAMISQTSGHGDFRQPNEMPGWSGCALGAVEVAGVAAIADGVPEVLKKTREQLLQGASQIKIMAGGGITSYFDPIDSLQYTPDEMRAAVAAASDWGTYVCAHVYTSAGIQRALSCGVKCIEHGQLTDEETVRRMAASGTWWSLQPFISDEFNNPAWTAEQRAQYQKVSDGTERAYVLGKKYDVNMAFGTDILMTPEGTVRQGKHLTNLSRWFDNGDVLRQATIRNASLLALSGPRNPYRGSLGVIEPGALADLLLVDGNPLDNLAMIADPDKSFKLVMKDGRIYKDTLSA
ncbi:MAG TPA: amidohydrolase family protein [Candidatus Cybelea sp.]|jgi:imidazolonepropionase-like amidohydrolase